MHLWLCCFVNLDGDLKRDLIWVIRFKLGRFLFAKCVLTVKLCVKAFLLFNLLSFQWTDLICYDIYIVFLILSCVKGQFSISVYFVWGKSCSETEFVFAWPLFNTGLLKEFHKPVTYGIKNILQTSDR